MGYRAIDILLSHLKEKWKNLFVPMKETLTTTEHGAVIKIKILYP